MSNIDTALQTPLTEKDIWFPPLVVSLLEQNGVRTLGELLNMTYQEIDNIRGFGRANTFKICLRAQRFSPEAFYDSKLARSIETIDERKYSQYNIVYAAVSKYKEYKKQVQEDCNQNSSL